MKVLECLDFNWDCQIKLKYIMKKFNNLKKNLLEIMKENKQNSQKAKKTCLKEM